MRSKIIRNISVCFLWVAIIAINAHMIIPHDHHEVESVASQENTCPVTSNNAAHHTGFPVHCHACNDLSYEKAVIPVVFRNIQCKYFTNVYQFDFTAFKIHTKGLPLFELAQLPDRAYTPDLTLLRAPPSQI
jgi:hypothetical protein